MMTEDLNEKFRRAGFSAEEIESKPGSASAKSPNEPSKLVFGTKEWAKHNVNLISGCSHDCKYCYAKATAVRFKKKTIETWKDEEVRTELLSKALRKRDGVIMFPTSHDITPLHLKECMVFLKNILNHGNRVLIVSKPHFECIKAICDEFSDFKDQILFRFTIGSSRSATLRFWEPNAPDFSERLAALKYAHEQGYQTSVSCEPMLDDNMRDLIERVSPFVTDSIWLGKANGLLTRLGLNGHSNSETIKRARGLLTMQSNENIRKLYAEYKDNPQIKWKDSIKRVIGIGIQTEAGMDV